MDPNTYKVPELALPSPPSFQGASVSASSDHPSHGPQTSQHPAPHGALPLAPAAVPIDPQHMPTVAAPADDTSDDLDEEWVAKAKAIVEKTKLDPRLQSRELGKVKADYLKIRYNKDIKVAEDHK